MWIRKWLRGLRLLGLLWTPSALMTIVLCVIEPLLPLWVAMVVLLPTGFVFMFISCVILLTTGCLYNRNPHIARKYGIGNIP